MQHVAIHRLCILLGREYLIHHLTQKLTNDGGKEWGGGDDSVGQQQTMTMMWEELARKTMQRRRQWASLCRNNNNQQMVRTRRKQWPWLRPIQEERITTVMTDDWMQAPTACWWQWQCNRLTRSKKAAARSTTQQLWAAITTATEMPSEATKMIPTVSVIK